MTEQISADTAERPLKEAMLRGFRNRCPACGKGRLFARFLKATPACDFCGEDMTRHSADDLPPYLSIIVTGHVVVPIVLEVEMAYHPSMAFHMITWPLVTLIMAGALIQPFKGAVIGLQWAFRMHGFGSGNANHQ